MFSLIFLFEALHCLMKLYCFNFYRIYPFFIIIILIIIIVINVFFWLSNALLIKWRKKIENMTDQCSGKYWLKIMIWFCLVLGFWFFSLQLFRIQVDDTKYCKEEFFYDFFVILMPPVHDFSGRVGTCN